jgi:tetratricopeptide (TPR) repeat protein
MVAASVAIAALTFAAYGRALVGGFVWDDDAHVTQQALLSLHGLARIWFEPGATQQYYPFLHSIFWVEHHLWGDAPLGYHLANILLHLLACLLLYRVLRRLEVPGALLAAAVFAVHPVCVESVAWISEQKNTLSTVLYMGTALAFLRYDEGRRLRWHVLATALFALALLSKSVTASLPAALLVVLWWKGRLSWKGSVLPLAPWFLMSAAAAFVTPWVERKFVGAYGASFDLGMAERVLIAGRAVWFYLSKVVWPADLVFIYPRWKIDVYEAWQYAFPAAAAAVLGLLLWMRPRTRGALAASLLYVGTLFPALGFINVYPFVFSFVADHFQYLAAAGMISALSAALTLLARRLPKGLGPTAVAAAAALVLALAALTWRQCRVYGDLETFYRAILEKNPQAWLAHDNLGVVLVRKGKLDEAVGHYKEAIRLKPDYPEAYNNYGNVLAQTAHWVEAGDAYAGALRARPSFDAAEYNWGNAMNDAGLYREAQVHFRNALTIKADQPIAHYGLANALANLGRIAEAIPEYAQALRLLPDYPEAHANLGLALAELGRWDEALAHIAEAIRLRPGYAEAHAYQGFALAGAGRLAEALAAYQEALRVGPNTPDIHEQMGLALERMGRSPEAAQQFAEARRLGAAH